MANINLSLVKMGAEMSSLTNKIRHKDIAGVKESVLGGADISRKDKKGNTPLHVAAEDDALDIAKLLIECGAPLEEKNAQGKRPFEVKPGTRTSSFIMKAALETISDSAEGGLCIGL